MMHTFCKGRFSDFDKKAVIYLFFLLEHSDLKNVTFEKTPWAPSEVTEVKGGRMVKKQDFEAVVSLKVEIISKN